jgi:acyl-CoA synthetase (AMP-forming)/AMP-acid ligase II
MNVSDLNFGDLIEAVAGIEPDRPAVIHGERVLSWGELDARSNRLARRLAAAGLLTHSKVAFYLRNSPAYIELLTACAKGRYVHANVNYRYVDDELFHVLDNSDSEAVVYDAEFRPHVESLRTRLPKVRIFLEVGSEALEGPAESFEAACSRGDASPLGNERSGEDLYFMYTGGTTGYPKGVMWQHKDRIAAVAITDAESVEAHRQKIMAAGPGATAMPACPLMHSTGFTTALATLINGGALVLLPGRTFDPGECLHEIERHQVARLAIVGDAFSVPILDYLREHPDRHDLLSVVAITSAGAMWSEHCKRGLLEHFPNATLSDSLGSSEGSRLGSAITRQGETTATASFVVGEDVKVFTEDFREVQPGSGEAGMIAKSGALPLGYYKDEAGTAKTFPVIDGVRYSLAGDWCRIEADGTMTLLGRGNNCINTGGEKVYPEEVEEVLKRSPGIYDAAVLGVPDPRWGQAVTAAVRTVGDGPLDEPGVRRYLDAHLARYKHPKTITAVHEPLRHENGKVNYRGVRRLLDPQVTEARDG